MNFTVAARRVDAHGSLARCREAEITLDTDLAGCAAQDGVNQLSDPYRHR